jgi:hypothetical protein
VHTVRWPVLRFEFEAAAVSCIGGDPNKRLVTRKLAPNIEWKFAV